MMKINLKALLGTLLLAPSLLLAEDRASLAQQVAELKARTAELEKKLEEVSTSTAAAASATDSKASPLTALTSDIQVSGFADSIYSYNFNSPGSGTNVGRYFDHDSNSFMLNAFEIAIQKAVSAENPVGFRADLYAGQDAKLIHSAGLGDSSDYFDLEQAYIEVNAPTSSWFSGMNDLNLKFGKFVTLAGAEVVEGKDNFNTSRSFAFNYALPFAHTGARATYTFDNSWDIILGINNGWDVADDNNAGKTFEGHVGFNNLSLPFDSTLTVALQGYVGAELSGNNGSTRKLGDLVMTYKTPWKPLTLVYNFDYGSQEDGVAEGESADWYGHVAYFRYEFCTDWSFTGRGEFFKDQDGYRVVAGTPANYREFTATLEYRPWKNLITRLEYRNDHASEAVFGKNSSGSDKSQDTLSGQAIVLF